MRLDLNELVPYIDRHAFDEIIKSLEPWMFSAYPETSELSSLLAQKLGLSTEHIILTSGSDGGIRQVIDTFCDPLDAIITTYPTFGMYGVYASVANLELVRIWYKDDFTIDIQCIIETMTSSTKLVAIANPNGAIGCVVPKPEVEQMIAAASRMGIVVLLDETFVDCYVDHWTRRIDEFDNLVIVRSFSKASGLAGLRLGYILTNPVIGNLLLKTRPYMEPNSVAVQAGCYLLSHPEVTKTAVQQMIQGRAFLVSALRERGFVVYAGETNFILVKLGSQRARILKELETRRIRVMDLQDRDLISEYTRITVGPYPFMEAVIAAIDCHVA